jgi:valyl-tRNA synthetase
MNPFFFELNKWLFFFVQHFAHKKNHREEELEKKIEDLQKAFRRIRHRRKELHEESQRLIVLSKTQDLKAEDVLKNTIEKMRTVASAKPCSEPTSALVCNRPTAPVKSIEFIDLTDDTDEELCLRYLDSNVTKTGKK